VWSAELSRLDYRIERSAPGKRRVRLDGGIAFTRYENESGAAVLRYVSVVP
jgi:hypothetical protein